MSVITRLHKTDARGFTLVETLLATFVAFYVMAAAWSIYMVTWTWWSKVYPETRAESTARAAVSGIVYGAIDSTAGTDVIGAGTYERRNGVAWACFDPNHTPPNSPAIYKADGSRVMDGYDADTGYGSSNVGTRVDFQLESDSSSVRRFYLGTDPATGSQAVYYRNSLSQISMVNGTLGLVNEANPSLPPLEISYYTYLDTTQSPAVEVTDYNIIRVAAYVVKKAAGSDNYITVRYADYIYLRNTI